MKFILFNIYMLYSIYTFIIRCDKNANEQNYFVITNLHSYYYNYIRFLTTKILK